MDIKLKQRMIGAVVLITLAIIILPMLLDGSAEDRARVVAQIPDPPTLKLTAPSVTELELKVEEMEQASAAAMPELVVDESPEQGAPDEVQLDENRLPVSWSLQVASFRDQDRALKLRADLREAEYQAYIIKGTSEGAEIWRVFIGPMLQRSRVDDIRKKIEDDFQLKGQIVRYRVEDDAGQLGG